MTGMQPFATRGRGIATMPQIVGPGYYRTSAERFRIAANRILRRRLNCMDPTNLRAATLARFRAWALEANEHLPLLESETDLKPKTAGSVAVRAIAAGYVAALCFGADMQGSREDLERFELWTSLTDEERQLFGSDVRLTAVKDSNSWVVEAIQCMAWALCKTGLKHFSPCDENLRSLLPMGVDPSAFCLEAELRPLDVLCQEADTLYMLHWRAVENNLRGVKDPRLVLPRISFRRHAADWMIGTAEAWEDVPLDT